jgi:hypothetical protein
MLSLAESEVSSVGSSVTGSKLRRHKMTMCANAAECFASGNTDVWKWDVPVVKSDRACDWKWISRKSSKVGVYFWVKKWNWNFKTRTFIIKTLNVYEHLWRRFWCWWLTLKRHPAPIMQKDVEWNKQDRQCTCKRNMDVRSRNSCCSGKAISVTYCIWH